MKYSKIWLCMTALVCLTFQAFAQDPLGAGSSGSSMGSGGDWISPNMGQVAVAAQWDLAEIILVPTWAKSTRQTGWKADMLEVLTVR